MVFFLRPFFFFLWICCVLVLSPCHQPILLPRRGCILPISFRRQRFLVRSWTFREMVLQNHLDDGTWLRRQHLLDQGYVVDNVSYEVSHDLSPIHEDAIPNI